eukprot:11385734-Alexandrium_andersonii.AAC.1
MGYGLRIAHGLQIAHGLGSRGFPDNGLLKTREVYTRAACGPVVRCCVVPTYRSTPASPEAQRSST